MNVYLVSKVICWPDETMDKEFYCFENYEDAIAYKNKLLDLYVCGLCDYFDLEENSLDALLDEDYLTVVHDGNRYFSAISFDGTEEIDIEVTELEVR